MTRVPVVLSLIILTAMVIASDRHAAMLWPLPSSRTITGGFADTRPDHFHGGVDIRAREPLPVVAPTDGWIERIAVSPSGYGRVLYFRIEDGRTAVFGHLSRFAPSVETAMRDSQIVGGTYRIDVSYSAPLVELTFQRGDTLAYTGRTGIGPPHLHYEIREGAVQTDPLANYDPADRTAPVIVGIWWTTRSAYSPTSNGTRLEAPKKGNKWLNSRHEPIHADEPIAFFIQTYDPGPWGRNAVPTVIRVRANGEVVREEFTGRIDLAAPKSYYESIVWSLRKQFKRDVRRLFDPPPPGKFAFSILAGSGWSANLDHADVTIEVQDRAGNITRAIVPATCGSSHDTLVVTPPTALSAGTFTLANSDPSLAWATMSSISPSEVFISPSDIGFAAPCTLSYRYAPAARTGLYFYEQTSSTSARPIWRLIALDSPEYMSCEILRGGTYGVALDTRAPDLSLSVMHGSIHFTLTDDDSRVDDSTIRCQVDGATAIPEFEYEDRGGFIWTQSRLAAGTHEVNFVAGDRAGNMNTWRSTIQVP